MDHTDWAVALIARNQHLLAEAMEARQRAREAAARAGFETTDRGGHGAFCGRGVGAAELVGTRGFQSLSGAPDTAAAA